MKPVQYFSDDYLKTVSKSTPSQIADFLDQFIKMSAKPKAKSRLISLRIPEDLLQSLKIQARRERIPYQTLIKRILQNSVT